MRTYPALFVALPCFALLAATHVRPPANEDLIQAISQNKVAVTATSLGRNAEECARLVIRNTSPALLKLSLSPGTLLNTVNEGDQDILVTRELAWVIPPGKSVTANAYGFCCQASNGISAEGDELRVTACTDPNLLALARHLHQAKYDAILEQQAIWAVSDNHSIGGILNDRPMQYTALRKFTADLLHQPVPTYDVDYGHELNTQFVYAPKTLSGSMHYQVRQSGKATLELYDPQGNLFQTFYRDRPMGAGIYTQRFSYRATEMPAGQYVAKLTIDGKELSVCSITL